MNDVVGDVYGDDREANDDDMVPLRSSTSAQLYQYFFMKYCYSSTVPTSKYTKLNMYEVK